MTVVDVNTHLPSSLNHQLFCYIKVFREESKN